MYQDTRTGAGGHAETSFNYTVKSSSRSKAESKMVTASKSVMIAVMSLSSRKEEREGDKEEG